MDAGLLRVTHQPDKLASYPQALKGSADAEIHAPGIGAGLAGSPETLRRCRRENTQVDGRIPAFALHNAGKLLNAWQAPAIFTSETVIAGQLRSLRRRFPRHLGCAPIAGSAALAFQTFFPHQSGLGIGNGAITVVSEALVRRGSCLIDLAFLRECIRRVCSETQ